MVKILLMSFPDKLTLNIDHFFPHLIIHPQDAIEEDLKLTWAASIILGIFTIGLVHGICALYAYFSKNAEVKTESQSNLTQTELLTKESAQKIFTPPQTPAPKPGPLNPKPLDNNTVKSNRKPDAKPIQKPTRAQEKTTLTGFFSFMGGKPGYVGYKEEWDESHPETEFLLNISLEDGSPFPFAPEDVFCSCEIYQASDSLKEKNLPYPLILPMSFLREKKDGEIIRFRYQGELVNLRIAQRPYTGWFYSEEGKKRIQFPSIEQILDSQKFQAEYDIIHPKYPEKTPNFEPPPKKALLFEPTPKVSLLSNKPLGPGAVSYKYDAVFDEEGLATYSLIPGEKEELEFPEQFYKSTDRCVLFNRDVLTFKMTIPDFHINEGDTLNIFLDESRLIFCANTKDFLETKKRENTLFVFYWPKLAENLECERLKALNFKALKDKFFHMAPEAITYDRELSYLRVNLTIQG